MTGPAMSAQHLRLATPQLRQETVHDCAETRASQNGNNVARTLGQALLLALHNFDQGRCVRQELRTKAAICEYDLRHVASAQTATEHMAELRINAMKAAALIKELRRYASAEVVAMRAATANAGGDTETAKDPSASEGLLSSKCVAKLGASNYLLPLRHPKFPATQRETAGGSTQTVGSAANQAHVEWSAEAEWQAENDCALANEKYIAALRNRIAQTEAECESLGELRRGLSEELDQMGPAAATTRKRRQLVEQDFRRLLCGGGSSVARSSTPAKPVESASRMVNSGGSVARSSTPAKPVESVSRTVAHNVNTRATLVKPPATSLAPTVTHVLADTIFAGSCPSNCRAGSATPRNSAQLHPSRFDVGSTPDAKTLPFSAATAARPRTARSARSVNSSGVGSGASQRERGQCVTASSASGTRRHVNSFQFGIHAEGHPEPDAEPDVREGTRRRPSKK